MEETKQINQDHPKTSKGRQADNMDETVSSLVSEIVQQSASDLNELMQLIKNWDAEERAASQTVDSAAGCSTQQNIEEYLTWFFDQRRKFAEDHWDENNKLTTKSPDRLDEVIFVTEAESSASLSTISDNNRNSNASSPCSTSAISEVTKAELPARTTMFKRMKTTWRKRFGRKNNEVGSLSESQEDEDNKDRSLSLKSDQISTSSKVEAITQ
ncbi:hypothetical protein Q5P01_003914 [Channa striata]|uniref:Uncharacterized protein n=1 Tax=Channa striata TaxID=64152 RepID=A0AA88NGS2_CHASR|nr:hypothetical protein Q5P01_003914 [Channa striata]